MSRGGPAKIILKTAWFLTTVIFLFVIFLAVNHFFNIRKQKIYGYLFLEQNNIVASLDKKSSIPVLLYHHVRNYCNPFDPIGEFLSVSPDTFKKQMQWLADHDYQAITPEQMLEIRSGKLVLNKKPVIITFDDGYEKTARQAFPILKEFGYSGVFFIVPGFIGRSDYLNTSDIQWLNKQGAVIGLHSFNHLDLGKISWDEQELEIVRGQEVLEDVLGQKMELFAYPYGKFNQDTLSILSKRDFKLSFSVKNKIADKNDDVLDVPRVIMTEKIDLNNILY